MTPKASIFAGGAGKTTAYFELVSKQVDLGRRINVDEISTIGASIAVTFAENSSGITMSNPMRGYIITPYSIIIRL